MKHDSETACEAFLNIFSLIHFGYLDDATRKLEEIVNNGVESTNQQTQHHAQKVADVLLNWVAEIKQEKRGV